MKICFFVQTSPAAGGGGGIEGGNRLYIYGANFAQNGLNSQYLVFVGNSECPIIPYYSDDNTIVCIVPPCSDLKCLSSDDYRGGAKVDVNVYVQTVETILGASTTYTYNYYNTPLVLKMLHTVWGTATGYIAGRFSTSSPTTDVHIKINNQYADIGDSEDLNTGTYYTWSTSTLLYYRPPGDAPAGFLNMSVVVDNWSQAQYMEPGAANFYPIRMPLDYRYDYNYKYNFASSLAGVSYSTLLLPVVASVSPRLGSVAGGTVVTINGHGFSYNATDMTVIVAGEPCTVLSSNPNQITCVTGPSTAVSESVALDQSVVAAVQSGYNLELNSSRPYGSAGAWIKVWNTTKIGSDSRAVLSFPWRNGLNIAFYYMFGGNYWPSQNGISGISNSLVFSLQLETVFIAPYSGRYKFYFAADDYGTVYDASGAVIANMPGYVLPDNFNAYASQTSKWIRLYCGQRYPIKITSVWVLSLILYVRYIFVFSNIYVTFLSYLCRSILAGATRHSWQ